MNRVRAIFVVGCLALVTVGLPRPAGAQSLDELRIKYPWGGLYVTGSALVDLNYIGDSSLVNHVAHQDGLPTLLSFVRQVGRNQITRHIAVLHVDLRDLRAGYSAPGNSQGLLTPLPWSREQVLDVARWLDRYFTTNYTIVRKFDSLSSSTGVIDPEQLRVVLDAVHHAPDDPFISPIRALQIVGEFRAWTAVSAGDLAVFYEQDHELFNEIYTFQSHFDRAYFSADAPQIREFLPQHENLTGLDQRWIQPLEISPAIPQELQLFENLLREFGRQP